MIVVSYTVIDVRAMVIKSFNALIADVAVS